MLGAGTLGAPARTSVFWGSPTGRASATEVRAVAMSPMGETAAGGEMPTDGSRGPWRMAADGVSRPRWRNGSGTEVLSWVRCFPNGVRLALRVALAEGVYRAAKGLASGGFAYCFCF